MSCDFDPSQLPQFQFDNPAICGLAPNYNIHLIESNQRPTITLYVNFHFLQNNGGGNFRATDDGMGNTSPNGYQYAQLMVDEANRILSENVQMNLPIGNTTPILPINIRIEIYRNPNNPNDQGIYFPAAIDDDYIYKTVRPNLYKERYSVNNNNVIDVYMVCNRNGIQQLGGWGPDDVWLVDAWNSKRLGIWEPYQFGRLLMHEIGHVLGLEHSFEGRNNCSDINSTAELNFGPKVTQNGNTIMTGRPWDSGSNNVMGYNVSNQSWTPCQLGIVHRFLSINTPSFAKVDWCQNNSAFDAVIYSGNTVTWNSARYLKGNVIVESGATLIVQCRVSMPNGSKVIVQPGGKLIVDGGQLTNSCGGLWQGIELWGNNTLSQEAIGLNTYAQPYVEVKNGGEVSYAIDAITNANPANHSTAGGIIKCSNAVFKNNIRAIQFLKYQNFNPTNPTRKLANRSSFSNTQFITSEQLPDNAKPKSFVTAWAVDGINFYNCTFENTAPNVTGGRLSDLGKGIYSIDANYTVTGCNTTLGCINSNQCCDFKPSKFKNLEYGIQALNGSTNWNYKVDKAEFENCGTGISNEGVNKAVITRNKFTLGRPTYFNYLNSGIYFNTGTSFRIEENTFSKDPQTPSGRETYGIWLANTGGEQNLTYKNVFNNIDIGNLAYGQNRAASPDDIYGQYYGLAFYCNSHNNLPTSDIHAYGMDSDDGIRQYQGGVTGSIFSEGAGNSFSWMNAYSGQSDFVNTTPLSIVYGYNESLNPKEFPQYVSPKVVRVEALNRNECPSKFRVWSIGGLSTSVGIGVQSDIALGAMRTKFSIQQNLYNKLLDQYKALIDGGSTGDLKLYVERANVTESEAVYKKLLSIAPYISKEVLQTANDRADLLSESQLSDILKANPDCFKYDNFVEHIQIRNNRLPIWLIIALKTSSTENITSRAIMEANLSFHKSEMEEAANFITNSMLSQHEVGKNIDWNEYREWLKTYKTLNAEFQLADNYLANNMHSNAEDLFNSLPKNFKLSEKDIRDYNGFRYLYYLLHEIQSTGRSYFELDEYEKSALGYFAESGTGVSQVRACNILSFIYGNDTCLSRSPKPDFQALNQSNSLSTALANPILQAYPVPAENNLTVVYDAGLLDSKPTLAVIDISGKVITNLTSQSSSGRIEVNTNDYSNGIYTLMMYVEGKKLASSRIIIAK